MVEEMVQVMVLLMRLQEKQIQVVVVDLLQLVVVMVLQGVVELY